MNDKTVYFIKFCFSYIYPINIKIIFNDACKRSNRISISVNTILYVNLYVKNHVFINKTYINM